ncbi:hypothetical protein K438DRAFT_1944002 [Mycena galopus ATCC 62051]|nr:hypothetical protein K438DRAFT_1944002 [Mycena galopus ATCC 62051]
MPKRIWPRNRIIPPAYSDSLEDSSHGVYAEQRLPDVFTRNPMAESSKHTIEHSQTGASEVRSQSTNEKIQLIVRFLVVYSFCGEQDSREQHTGDPGSRLPSGNSVEEQEELEQKELLETLDVLLREGDIDESFLDDTTNSPEARASYEVGAVQDTCLDNSSRS